MTTIKKTTETLYSFPGMENATAEQVHNFISELIKETGYKMAKENTIFLAKQTPRELYEHAKYVLHNRWPEAEPYIKKNEYVWKEYEERFLIW